MQPALIPKDDESRLQKLSGYKILDTSPEEQFDRITRIIAETIGVPIALVSLVDRDRQWFKSKFGLDAEETPRDIAFCAHAILGDSIFVVPDATKDSRFSNNPLVTNDPKIRFYAGAPLTTPDGIKLGTLCAIDREPRTLTEKQAELLTDLAKVVVDEMELRIALEYAVDEASREAENSRLKDEFISVVSHELRTPLTSINGALGLIVDGAMDDLSANMRELVSIAHRNGERLALLINDILDIEKLIAGKMHFDMEQQELLPLINQAIEENQTYSVDRCVRLALAETTIMPIVKVDGQRLLQVLSNLISNAVKYSPEDGAVTISVEPVGRMVRVSVSDQGPGVPLEFRSRIFEKFAQADSSDTRQAAGTGLGLAISREIVLQLGGQIDFETELGKGSIFYFDLPVANVDNLVLPPDAGYVGQGSDEPRLLVVEDDHDVVHLLRLLLQPAGYDVDVAYTGVQALKAMDCNTYRAITIDLNLPDMSGLELLRQVRQRSGSEDLPILVISANTEEGKVAINSDFANIDWLQKPIDQSRLLSTLETLVSKETRRLRVLHVEDDTDLHRVIELGIGRKIDLSLVTTLAEARARLSGEPFDVIILDIAFPDGSGWELLPEIREKLPNARVVILSGADVTPEQTGMVEAALLKSRMSADELLDTMKVLVDSSRSTGAAL